MKSVATRWSFPVTLFGHGAGWSGRFFGWDEYYTAVGAMSAGKFDLSERPCVFRRKLLAPAVMRVSYYRAPAFGEMGARYVWEANEDGSEGTATACGSTTYSTCPRFPRRVGGNISTRATKNFSKKPPTP